MVAYCWRDPVIAELWSASIPYAKSVYTERTCADTFGTVPVPCAGHFQC